MEGESPNECGGTTVRTERINECEGLSVYVEVREFETQKEQGQKPRFLSQERLCGGGGSPKLSFPQ